VNNKNITFNINASVMPVFVPELDRGGAVMENKQTHFRYDYSSSYKSRKALLRYRI